MPFPLFSPSPLTSDFSLEPLEIKAAPHFIFAPKENEWIEITFDPKSSLPSLSPDCNPQFLGQPGNDIHSDCQCHGDVGGSLIRREERGKMFLPVKIYRITTKVELAPLFAPLPDSERDSEGRRTEEEKAGRKMKLLLHSPLPLPFLN